MRPLVNIIALVISLSGIALRAELRELKDGSGICVQVAVDFIIEKIEITPEGTMKFVARTTDAGSELGFVVTIDKPKEGQISIYEGGELPVMKTGVEFHSLGEATARLERLVLEKLHDRTDDVEEPYHIAGPYTAVSSRLDTGFPYLMVLHLHVLAGSYDENGKQIAGIGFRTELVIDAPMGRMTAYFSNQGGYGGRAPADKARTAWLNKTKTPNQ